MHDGAKAGVGGGELCAQLQSLSCAAIMLTRVGLYRCKAWDALNAPCVADCELKPVGVACVPAHDVGEAGVADLARRREPLHLPAAVPILVQVQAAKGALRAAAGTVGLGFRD